MKKRTVFGVWITIALLLILLSNTLPTLHKVNGTQDYTYSHPKDGYTLDITGYWQVYEEKEQNLVLADTEHDATVSFRLEVGGYDYLTPQSTAEQFYRELKKVFSDIQIIDGPTEGTVNGYKTVAFLSKFTENNQVYYNEVAILHPNEGIRLYTSFIYPKGLDKAIIAETESMINTLQFEETEELYPKYM